jgi:tetratricopeptide (TPR) repeat protein
VLQVVCSALDYKAEVLVATGDQVGAQRAFAEIWRRFGDADDLRLQAEVLGARVRSAVVLMEGGGLLEGIALLDEVLGEAPEVRNEAGEVRIAQALGNKAWALYRLGRVGDALVTDTELIDRFGESPIPMIREQVAAALDQKADALSGLGEYEEALDATSRLHENFANDSDPAIRSSIANALLTRARILIYLRRDSEAEAELARSKEYLSDARLAQRAEALEIEGTLRLYEGDPFTALSLYDQSIELSREAEADGGRYIRALTVSKRADALVKLGRTREARESLSSLVREFGEDGHPTPQEIVERAKSALAALA